MRPAVKSVTIILVATEEENIAVAQILMVFTLKDWGWNKNEFDINPVTKWARVIIVSYQDAA